jgi:hypothetical protein
MNFGPGYIGFLIYPYRISDISIAIKWTYRKWGYPKWPYISDFQYNQTDMSIFSYGYIGMDYRKWWRQRYLKYWKSDIFRFLICPDRYVHFGNGLIRNGHIGNDVIKCIGIQICHFPICPFSDKPPFLPAPRFNCCEICCFELFSINLRLRSL